MTEPQAIVEISSRKENKSASISRCAHRRVVPDQKTKALALTVQLRRIDLFVFRAKQGSVILGESREHRKNAVLKVSPEKQ